MEYAIDFGTSNTVVARRDSTGKIETVKLPFGVAIANQPSLIPSLVYVENAEEDRVIIGQSVRDKGLDRPNERRFFQGFKRAICQPAPAFMPVLDGKQISWQAIATSFLKQIIAQLTDVDSLTFTVPVDSFETYRQWLTEFCQISKIAQIKLLDEPTAAALNYQLTETSQSLQNLLVIDFGGGTLDLVWVQLERGSLAKSGDRNWLKWGKRIGTKAQATAKVIAKYGMNLGGIDIDRWILDFWIQTEAIPRNSLTLRLAEKLKILLSTQDAAVEVYFDDRTFNSYELHLNRENLNRILEQHDFFANLDRSLNQIQTQAANQGLKSNQVDGVILVGGSCQLSALQTWVYQHFELNKIHSYQPFEAIAHGALSQTWQLQDILYHSYGVRYWDKKYQRHSWHPLIASGTAFPTQPVELVLGASKPNQPSIELVIGEIGEASVEVLFEENNLIARNLAQRTMVVQPLNDSETSTIAQLNPLGNPGCDRIKVSFLIDSQCILRMTVFDLLTKKTLVENQVVVELR
jgi:molecular chaperone DnaK (HSP70)